MNGSCRRRPRTVVPDFVKAKSRQHHTRRVADRILCRLRYDGAVRRIARIRHLQDRRAGCLQDVEVVHTGAAAAEGDQCIGPDRRMVEKRPWQRDYLRRDGFTDRGVGFVQRGVIEIGVAQIDRAGSGPGGPPRGQVVAG